MLQQLSTPTPRDVVRYVEKGPYIAVVDVETDNKEARLAYILEIAIVCLSLKTGEIGVVYDSIVRSRDFFPKDKDIWILKNSSLKLFDIYKAPTLESQKIQIQAILNQYYVTAFNAAYDFTCLERAGFRILHKAPCIMLQATDVCKLHSNYGYKSYKWPKVEEAWNFLFGNPYKEAHRAYDDAYHEAQILWELIQRKIYDLSFLTRET